MGQVGIEVLYIGYIEACSRYSGSGEPIHDVLARAVRSGTLRPWFNEGPTIEEAADDAAATAFRSLFEALNWATALDERLRKDWPESADPWHRMVPWGMIVPAVRYTRNRAHHQWAEVLALFDQADGALPARMGPWVWCWKAELPPAPKQHRDEHGERLYGKLLAGQPVIGTLTPLMLACGKAVRALYDQGLAGGKVLEELLPAIDGMDPSDFPGEAAA